VSAVDNAKYVSGEQGTDLDVDNLYVKNAIANDGPRMKRIRPAPMGRAYRYQRRLTHITVSVAERGETANLVTKVEAPVAAESAETKGKAKAAAKGKTAGAKKPAAKKTVAKKSAK
jgi:large subunit ribosomal protein L22